MSDQPYEWTREERERAQQITELDARQLTNGKTAHHNPVSPTECQAWRDQLASNHGESPGDITNVSYSRSTIRKHVTGDCTHPIREVGLPVTYRDGEWQRTPVVSTGTESQDLRVYHTRECKEFPSSVRAASSGELGRLSMRECRECSGRVPEAKPIPRRGEDEGEGDG